MLTSTKPPRCQQCRKRLDKPGLRIHEECVDAFVARMREKKAERLAKKERQIHRERKAAIKTIPQLIKEAQREFNAYIRARDGAQTCICCGRQLVLGHGDVGGSYDAGHYRSTGSASHLRFDERNCHAQRKDCNRYGAGRAVDYRIGLIARIGLAPVEALEADNQPHKWTREELIAIRDTYRTKLRALKNATPLREAC